MDEQGLTTTSRLCAVSLALCNMDEVKRLETASQYGARVWLHTNSMGIREIELGDDEYPTVQVEDGFGAWVGHDPANVSYVRFESVHGSVLSFRGKGMADLWEVTYLPASGSTGRYGALYQSVVISPKPSSPRRGRRGKGGVSTKQATPSPASTEFAQFCQRALAGAWAYAGSPAQLAAWEAGVRTNPLSEGAADFLEAALRAVTTK